MHLYVLSEDGMDRESCNIFYSKYIVTEKPALKQLAKIVDGKITERGTIMVPRRWDEEDEVDIFNDPDRIMDELSKVGIKAHYPQPHWVIMEDG